MADIPSDVKDWSATTASNSPSGGTAIGTGLDDNLRTLQSGLVNALSHKGADIASAATTDLGAVPGLFHDITGTTTITAFGTVRAGIWKILKFEGALTLTHNATSLILLPGANRTTVVGDVGFYISEGSGNWRELVYMPVNAQLTGQGVKFPATQAASSDANTLDDYEEGGWTIKLQDTSASDAEGQTYTTQVGWFRKIGGICFIGGNLVCTSIGTLSTALRLADLPFTSKNTAGFKGGITITDAGSLAITSGMSVVGHIDENTNFILLKLTDSTGGTTGLLPAEFTDDGSISFYGHYPVD